MVAVWSGGEWRKVPVALDCVSECLCDRASQDMMPAFCFFCFFLNSYTAVWFVESKLCIFLNLAVLTTARSLFNV